MCASAATSHPKNALARRNREVPVLGVVGTEEVGRKGGVPSRPRDTEKGFPDGREEGAMCYNCGCGKPDDDMGDPKNITDKTFEEAAKASKQSPKEAKRKTLELLKIILEKK
ncbi:MAG: hypothetical protein WB712_10835 [Candidatus Deferrimicrobium sp.]